MTDAILHRLWGKAHDHPDYVKAEWGDLERLVHIAVYGDERKECRRANDLADRNERAFALLATGDVVGAKAALLGQSS